MALVGLEDVQGFNKAGRMDQALATLQKMVPENNAERAEIAFIMAQTLNMANRVQDAAAVIITAVNIAPDHFPYSNAAGYLLRKAKRTKEAETVLGHAASLENTPWEILNNLMLCYSDLNEHAKAKTISARCLDQERNAETLTSSGLVELRSGEYDKAEIYLKDAIDAQSDHADAFLLLAELSQKKAPDDHETILA